MAISLVRRGLLFFVLPILVLLGAAVWWFSRPALVSDESPVSSTPAAVRVHTARVQVRDVPVRVRGVGTVQAWQTVTVRAQIQGQLQSVGFQEGDTVHKGQLIAQLDDGAQRAQLAQAKAQYARDQAQLENARVDLERYVALARQSAVNRQTLDTQRAQVAALQATLKADEAQIQAAQVQLDYTRILAPLTGRTGVLQIDPGNLVHATDQNGLVTINQLDPIAVSFTVPDTAFPQVQAAWRRSLEAAGGALPDPGAPGPLRVEVLSPGGQQRLGAGVLVLVDNQIDLATATLRLKARLDNPDHTLWPGQTVDVQLILGDRPDALVVPDVAVQRGAQGLYVYVVDADQHAQVQPVDVLVSQDGLSVISKGLAADQQVVVDNQYKLRPGMLIAEAEPEPAASVAVQPAVKDQAAGNRS